MSTADNDISQKNVKFDEEILEILNNKTSGEEIWVPVMVRIKDTSGISIDYVEDSVEVQRIKDNQRNDILRNITDDVLSTISDEEFQLESKSEFGGIFAGDITKGGFEKLLQDSRVKKIYDNTVKGHESLYTSAPLINADYAWNSGYNGTGQTVCIIDSGVNYTHPALGGCFGSGCKVKGGYDYLNDDSNPMDDTGHGTRMAGIVASEDGTYRGIAPGADIVALKAGNSSNYDKNDVVYALQWCFNNRDTYNISIVSMSLGWFNGLFDTCGEDFADTELDNLYSVEIPVIAASGNDANDEEIEYQVEALINLTKV